MLKPKRFKFKQPIPKLKINKEVINKLPKGIKKIETKSTLDELIKSIPDYDKTELRIIKINNTYYEISKDRLEKSVKLDSVKFISLLNLERVINGKISSIKDIHTHIGDNPLPSANDILSAISLYQYNSKIISFPIVVVDPKTKQICGRSVVYLGKEATHRIVNNYRLSNLIKYNPDIVRDKINIEYHNYLLENRLYTAGRHPKTGEIIPVASKDAKTSRIFEYEYLKLLLQYKIKFFPYSGYKLNKETLKFEKI